MTIKQFKRFSAPEQDEIISNFGTYVTSYMHGDTMSDVYKMHSFYVKFCYDVKKDLKPTIIAFFDRGGLNLFKDVLSPLRFN